MERVAPAPEVPGVEITDARKLYKELRACYVCRLIKTHAQFTAEGCDNCDFLEMQDDRELVLQYTSAHFQGMLSVMDPAKSWATKWLHLGRFVPGCYAIKVDAELPEALRDLLDSRGIPLPQQQD